MENTDWKWINNDSMIILRFFSVRFPSMFVCFELQTSIRFSWHTIGDMFIRLFC